MAHFRPFPFVTEFLVVSEPAAVLTGLSAATGAKAPRSLAILSLSDDTDASVSRGLQRRHNTTPALHLSAPLINQTHSVTCEPPILDRELAEAGARLVLELIARRQATKYKYIVDSIGLMANADPRTAPYDSVVSGNAFPPHNSPHPCVLRREREEKIARYGQENTAKVQPTGGQATPEGRGTGDRSDRRGLRPERGRTAAAGPGAAGDGARADRPVSDIPRIARAKCLSDMLRCIHEYRAASPPFRPFWRKCALHEIARFRRVYLMPERQAFEAAVARSKQRRAAA